MSRKYSNDTDDASHDRPVRPDGGTGTADADATTTDADTTAADADEGLFPVEGKWFSVGFYLFLLSWLGYMLWESLGYTDRQDYLFPLVIGVPLAVVTIAKLLTVQFPEIVERVLPEESGQSEMFEGIEGTGSRESKAEREKYELYMIGWILVLPFMMYILGMGWTMLLYTFAFTWFFTRDVKTSLMVTAVVLVFVWILFVEILSLIIWDGVLGLTGPLEIIADVRS